jgi:hypothetical protein
VESHDKVKKYQNMLIDVTAKLKVMLDASEEEDNPQLKACILEYVQYAGLLGVALRHALILWYSLQQDKANNISDIDNDAFKKMMEFLDENGKDKE